MTLVASHRKLLLTFLTLAMVGMVAAFTVPHIYGHAVAQGPRRDSNQVRWDSMFRYNQPKYNFPASTRAAVRDGMSQWDSINTDADFHVYESSNDANVYVQALRFSRYSLGTSPGTIRQLMRNGRITFSAISLNREWNWQDTSCTINRNTKTAHVPIVITHEAGHMVRLEHDSRSSHRQTVIWPDDTCKLVTTSHDDDGVVALYGDQ